MGHLRRLLSEPVDLFLLFVDELLLLLELIVEVIFQHGVLLDEALLVAELAVVLRLAGEVHFLDLVLQLLKHQIRSIASLLSFLSTCDFDFGHLFGQFGYRVLLGGDQRAVEDFLDTALNVRLGYVTLRHLYQAVGVACQCHGELALELYDSLLMISLDLLAHLVNELEDVCLLVVAEVEEDGRLPRLGFRIAGKLLHAMCLDVGRRGTAASRTGRIVTRSYRLVLTSMRSALGGRNTLLRQVLHSRGVLASILFGILRKVGCLPPFMRCVPLVRVLDQLALRFNLKLVLT